MKLGKMKQNILKLLWETEAPLSLKGVSEKTGLKTRSVNMHLLGLVWSGYISKSEDVFTLTENGKEIAGLNKNFVERVLGKTIKENAFHFYEAIDRPLGIHSDNLIDFCEKIRSVDALSLEFHVARGDFDLWIHGLGDVELAKRLREIRDENLAGETLRDRLYKILKSRSDVLLAKVSYT